MTYCRDEQPARLGDARVSRLYKTYCYSTIYMYLSVFIRGSFNTICVPKIAIIATECFEPETSSVSSLPCFYTKRPRSPGQR